MAMIDPTARVEKGAEIGRDVSIGPYCIVGSHVVLGDGCRLVAHVHLVGHTTIGPRTAIYPFASLGTPPQSVHYKGEPTLLRIGADCDIRETVTMNIGTVQMRGETIVGDRCMVMAGAHVGHDCKVGNDVVFAQNATLGGVCDVGDHVFLGGNCAVHQFVRIGEQAMIGGMTGVSFDVIPYGTVFGDHAVLAGINRVGLKRRGFSNAAIHQVWRAYRAIFFGPGTMNDRLDRLAANSAGDPHAARLIEFIRSGQKRRLTTPRADRGADE